MTPPDLLTPPWKRLAWWGLLALPCLALCVGTAPHLSVCATASPVKPVEAAPVKAAPRVETLTERVERMNAKLDCLACPTKEPVK